MTINQLLEKLQLAKEKFGGETEVLLECQDDVEINTVAFASYTDPVDETNNLTELRLTDMSAEDFRDFLEYEVEYENVEVEEV